MITIGSNMETKVTRALRIDIAITVLDIKNMAALGRREKEELVWDLYYNQNRTYREVAKLARISPRDIKAILNSGTKDDQEAQTRSKAAQAYEMFQDGKSPMDVAITLDLPEPEVTKLYRESWNLKQIAELNRIYLETGGNLAPILNLYKSSSASGYNTSHVVWLLGVADKGLPEITKRYNDLKSAVDSLEAEKLSLIRLNQDYRAQTKALGRSFDNYCLQCEQEEKKLANLRRKRMKEEILIKQLESNDAEYIKFTKFIEERVHNSKGLLGLALSSLKEIIRKNPERYVSPSIHDNMPPSMISYNIMNYSTFSYGQWQPTDYFETQSTLIEDAAKLLEKKLAKSLEEEILTEYSVNTSQPSLPLSPS